MTLRHGNSTFQALYMMLFPTINLPFLGTPPKNGTYFHEFPCTMSIPLSWYVCLHSSHLPWGQPACQSDFENPPWQSHSDAHLLLFHFSTLDNIVKGGSREWTLHNQQSQRTSPPRPGAGGKHGLPQPTVLIAWPCGQLSLLTRKWHDAGRSCRIENGIILEMHGQEL